MTIGAHIPAGKMTGLLHGSLVLFARKYPGHHFIFFVDEAAVMPSDNCTQVIIRPRLKNKLLRHYWYNYKLPALLKRYNADVFITAAGLISLRTDVDQYLLFDDDIFSGDENLNRYHKKIFRASLLKAKGIFVPEDIFKRLAVEHLPALENKLCTVHSSITEHIDNSNEEQEALREKYSGGQAFFLYPVTPHSVPHLISLLKAFSQLKKWQRSSMKLLLLLKNIEEEGLIKDFKNYKHRTDVIFIKEEGNIGTDILNAAYALVFFNKYSPGNIGLKALYSGVPVIAEATKINEGIFGEAAMLSEANDKSLSEKMMRLYKDEHERQNMIAKGRLLAEKYDAGVAADKIWEMLTRK